jgi:hypothetical protein
MTDFKAGDRVEVIHDDIGSAYVGKRGSVYLVTDDHIEVEIDDDDGESYFAREELKLLPSKPPAEQRISDLEAQVKALMERLDDIEFQQIWNLDSRVRDVESGKAGENHSHYDLESKIRDTEYHTHHDYAHSRHPHDRWDLT